MKQTNIVHPISLVILTIIAGAILVMPSNVSSQSIPLPEHPRPDFMREQWQNLNGPWEFRFDKQSTGEQEKWFRRGTEFPREITVPFSWGAPLSNVPDSAHIGWYRRQITIPADWEGHRIYLVIGAADWHTKVWLDGQYIGEHKGGYTPFEFELTSGIKPGDQQELVIKIDDTPHSFKLEGKQGYGPARGIWQTPYLEARGSNPIQYVHFTPNINQETARVEVRFTEPLSKSDMLKVEFLNENIQRSPITQQVQPGDDKVQFSMAMENPRLWSLEDPFLYDVRVALVHDGERVDQVQSYFGMRKIGVKDLPGTDFPYITLNGEPIYLQMALDQAYHPEGYYTFPSDKYMRGEILRSKKIGLNGMRIHVKIGIPRKIYWADKLGMLIMEDIPNSWGEPTQEMKRETRYALTQMIQRDYNHPSIFSWILFNETWGLTIEDEGYTGGTQQWVEEMYRYSKSLDSSRLIEDNSPNKEDHVVTDINSWHAYLAGYEWESRLEEITEQTYPGAPWNFVEGRQQADQPLFNSECGNVWGYNGSTGDVDWSWDYHIMLNEFRQHPEVCGWLYTEHHDVINEWNGYYRYDRSEKYTGLDALADGMSLADLHSPFYISPEGPLCREVQPGQSISVPLWASFMTDGNGIGKDLLLEAELYGWNSFGEKKTYAVSSINIQFIPWMNKQLEPLRISVPGEPSLSILTITLKNRTGKVLHRNFTTFLVRDEGAQKSVTTDNNKTALSVSPEKFVDESWSLRQWNVLDGLKVNGAGAGYFQYQIPWPLDLSLEDIEGAEFVAEVSAKRLLGKDQPEGSDIQGNFMRGQGTHDPSANRNSYPMTDEEEDPSLVRVRINGIEHGSIYLEDDPADHRGILSWNSQLRDGYLREAGSYGYLIRVPINQKVLEDASRGGQMLITLEVDDGLPGGLAIYGKQFGRFPLDPSVIFVTK